MHRRRVSAPPPGRRYGAGSWNRTSASGLDARRSAVELSLPWRPQPGLNRHLQIERLPSWPLDDRGVFAVFIQTAGKGAPLVGRWLTALAGPPPLPRGERNSQWRMGF